VEQWKVIEKKAVPDRDGRQLVLVCERNGRQRQAVVSGATWQEKNVGDTVDLVPEFR
jgi:hypothetical protein